MDIPYDLNASRVVFEPYFRSLPIEISTQAKLLPPLGE
jgi:hypothetical protein